ncbi:MAG: GNAT family N-acetyltransferase [Chitinophagales bacterium]
MFLREAHISDIPHMHMVRTAVTENTLSNPDLISHTDYLAFLTERGKGWVWEEENKIVGFAIVDLQDHNIWALFILPEYEKKGIGKQLHDTMLNWYFAQTQQTVWLSTAPGTRAETFYRKAGWKHVGAYGKGELKFEMSYTDWKDMGR